MTPSVTTATRQAGSSQGQGCSRMLCAGLGSVVVEMRSQNTTFPSLRRLPQHGLAGGQGPKPPPLLSRSPVPGSARCGKSCIPPEPLKEGEAPLEQGDV